MAERGYLPKIFQKRSRYGTPTNGIILGTFVIIVFGCADFGQLLELLNGELPSHLRYLLYSFSSHLHYSKLCDCLAA